MVFQDFFKIFMESYKFYINLALNISQVNSDNDYKCFLKFSHYILFYWGSLRFF